MAGRLTIGRAEVGSLDGFPDSCAISCMSRLDDLRMVGELVGRSSFALSTSDDVIELRRGRSFGLTAARVLVGLFLLPFYLAPLLLVLDPGIPFNVPAAIFCLVWYGMLGGFTVFMAAVLFRWCTIRVDRRQGTIELRGSGRLLWLPRRVSIPFETVRELEVRMGSEGLRPTPFMWRGTYGARDERRRRFRISATVEGIDRREEAVHLTARIARLMGWEMHEVTRYDFGPAVRFGRGESSLANPQPIPRMVEISDYGSDPAESD